MTTMSRHSELSETIRKTHQPARSNESEQAMVKATESFVAVTAECQREMLSFMSMRLEKDGEMAQEMMSCKNLADAAAVHSRWMEETFRDYNAEAAKLISIYTNSVNGNGRANR